MTPLSVLRHLVAYRADERRALRIAVEAAETQVRHLRSELTLVTAERDALRKDMRPYCHTCNKPPLGDGVAALRRLLEQDIADLRMYVDELLCAFPTPDMAYTVLTALIGRDDDAARDVKAWLHMAATLRSRYLRSADR